MKKWGPYAELRGWGGGDKKILKVEIEKAFSTRDVE